MYIYMKYVRGDIAHEKLEKHSAFTRLIYINLCCISEMYEQLSIDYFGYKKSVAKCDADMRDVEKSIALLINEGLISLQNGEVGHG